MTVTTLSSREIDHRLTVAQMTLIEALAQPDAADVVFDLPRAKGLYRPAELS
jgi:hypothetical protein